MPGKYRNTRCEIDGQKFDSKREAQRWLVLKEMGTRGEVSGLLWQVRYRLEVNGQKIADYIADFTYSKDGVFIVEDCKGMRTPVYKLKKKLMKAIYGIVILET